MPCIRLWQLFEFESECSDRSSSTTLCCVKAASQATTIWSELRGRTDQVRLRSSGSRHHSMTRIPKNTIQPLFQQPRRLCLPDVPP